MTKADVMDVIKNEKLEDYNWFDDHNIKQDEVGIRTDGNTWLVYTSDERANPISEKQFDSESEALDNFIKRLRAKNKFKKLYK
ncbi:hypothetical protein JOC77_001087 [Peribacillus deserti]|uniref:DUF5659 domain-containing protein n=1 Tax=Peribacillus deserti TaxID=673318 RepID=A0ABS2QF69_9BACI|nr:Imm59 family immunity protein [Peribacillus deserti]MBM7691680.1 hypothetical protein [Peribacillus deserti]